MKIRIKFRKYGNLKYIGHLDVQRYFQKAVRRAGIDVAYTGGFSPHQIMSFAAPLGVGLESDGEYVDLEVNSFMGSADTVSSLNKAGAEGIEIVSVRLLPENAGNAMASVAAAGYLVRFREGREPDFDWKNGLEAFLEQSSILITKETKKNTLQTDIKPGIFALELRPREGIYMLLDASSGGNIKPAAVMEAYLNKNGESLKENALLITRTDTYTNVGTADAPHLVPLEEIGFESGPVTPEKK